MSENKSIDGDIKLCPMFAHRQQTGAASTKHDDNIDDVTSDSEAPVCKRQRIDEAASAHSTAAPPLPPPPPLRAPSPQPLPPPMPTSTSSPATQQTQLPARLDANSTHSLHDIDDTERMQMHTKLRDFDVLDEVRGDDDDDDVNQNADAAGERAGNVTGLFEYDDSSDTDLETDSGLTMARRRTDALAAKRAKATATVNSEQGNADESGAQGADADAVTADNFDDDLNEEELEALLNEGLPEAIRNKKFETQYDEKFKTVLVELDQNHFEVLPEGWVQVTHNSGMPLYLHTGSRVCSTSRPYFLGPGSVRKHEIPISAVPCLSYRRSLDKETKRLQQLKEVRAAHADKNDPNDPNIALHPIATQAVIETVHENRRKESLTPDQLTEYCRTLFRFKQVRVMRFKSWQARRKFTKSKKHIKNLQRPTLPEGTKLISFPIHHSPMPLASAVSTISGTSSGASAAAGGGSSSADPTNPANDLPIADHPRQRREWIMNPNGKSYVCILHEYVQHALKKQPTYEFKELENAATPYSATVSINDLKYGTGFGTSKKQAKSEAARETLEVLIPEMRDKITGIVGGSSEAKSTTTNATTVTSGEGGADVKSEGIGKDASNGTASTNGK